MGECVYCAHIERDECKNEVRIQTCTEHARGTASLAAEALGEQDLFQAGYIAGLLHDCGKFTDEFTVYLKKAVAGERVKKGSVIHTFAGVRYLLERFHSTKKLKIDDMPAEIVAAAIGSHHGLLDIWDRHMDNGFEHRLQKQPVYDTMENGASIRWSISAESRSCMMLTNCSFALRQCVWRRCCSAASRNRKTLRLLLLFFVALRTEGVD